jgi:RNA-binding proteins (RRM domain)
MNKKLYVGNLLYEVTDEDLKNQFSTVGNVVSATVIRYHDSGRSKGFGFVEMSSEEEAKKAIDTMNGQDFKGRKMVVSEARPPKPRSEFGGGFRQRNRFQKRENFDNQQA